MSIETEGLGKPDIELAGLRIWVHGREFHDDGSYWDGNWLEVTIECMARDATVRAAGWIILAWELANLLSKLEELYSTLDRSFDFKCIEPHLLLEFKAGKTGKIEFIVRLTPDLINQKHYFRFDIDQSYLPETIRQLREVLRAYPIRNAGTPKAMHWITTTLPSWLRSIFGVHRPR